VDVTTDRALSTVLDVTLCLILVSASVLTLVRIPARTPTNSTLDPTPTVLATSTATVNYSLAPSRSTERGTPAASRATDDGLERTAHGTLAGLLAAAAVSNATGGGRPLSPSGDGFERAVTAAVRNATGRRSRRIQVLAVWRPFPGARLVGRVVVGSDPATSEDVHATTLTVPSGFPSVRQRASRAARERGYNGVARVVAGGVVTGAFDANGTSVALAGPTPTARTTASRYRRFVHRYGVTVVRTGGRLDVERSNRRLKRTLARSFAATLRDRFDSPGAAAGNVSLGRVRLVVRTWST